MNTLRLDKVAWIILLLVVLFISTRFGSFTRAFASEETFQIMPGRFFAEGKGFFYYYGETNPELRTLYGHPPLTYLVSGIMSHWGQDITAGARLVPFLCGLAVFLSPFILTGSIVSSLLILLSPFFYSAANHVQTDPTFGLLGFVLLTAYIFYYFKDLPSSHYSKKLFGLLIGSMVILFLTKTVIAAIAGFTLVTLTLFVPKEFRVTYLIRVFFAGLVGFLSYMLTIFILSSLSGSSFSQSWEAPFSLIKGLVGSKLENHSTNPQSAWDDRYSIFRLLMQQRAVHFFGILLVTNAILLFWNRAKVSWKVVLSLFIAALVPFLTYFYVAYPGDGYPRYFLICFPPLLILLGYVLRFIEAGRWRTIISLCILLSAVLLMGDRLWKMFNEKGSVTVLAGREQLSKEAYQTIHALTKPGDLVLCFDQGILYLPDRKLLVAQDFYTYPDTYAKTEALAEDLKAALIYNTTPDSSEIRDQFLMKLVNKLVQKGAVRYAVGDFYIYVLPSGNES